MAEEEEQPPAEEALEVEVAIGEEGEEAVVLEGEEGEVGMEEGEEEQEAVEGEPEAVPQADPEDEGRSFCQACCNFCCGVFFFPIVLYVIGLHEKGVACEENVMLWLSTSIVDAKCDSVDSGKGKVPVFFSCEPDIDGVTPITLADFNPAMTSDLKDTLSFKELAVIQSPGMWQCVETLPTSQTTSTKTKTTTKGKKTGRSLLDFEEESQSIKHGKGGRTPRSSGGSSNNAPPKAATYKMEWHDKHAGGFSTKPEDVAARKKSCPGWTKNPMWPPGLHEGSSVRFPTGSLAGAFTLTPELMQELYPEQDVQFLKASAKLANLGEHAATGKKEEAEEAEAADADEAADEDADEAADEGNGGNGGNASSFVERGKFDRESKWQLAQLLPSGKGASRGVVHLRQNSLLDVESDDRGKVRKHITFGRAQKRSKHRPLMRSEQEKALALEEEARDEAENDDNSIFQREDEDEDEGENEDSFAGNASKGGKPAGGSGIVEYTEELDTDNTYLSADKTAIETCGQPPKVGCMRIQYYVFRPTTITFMGALDDAGATIQAPSPPSFFCEGGPRWWVMQNGLGTSAEWIKQIKEANKIVAILVRIILLLLAWWCVYCCFSPISYAADLIGDYLEMIPVCGECLEDLLEGVATVIICCLSCTIGCSCGFFVLAVVWVFMRPMIGVPLLLLTFILWCVAYKAKDATPEEERKRRRRPKAKAEPKEEEGEEEG